MTGDAAPLPTFGDLLKRYRVGARLSQEALAERAGLTAQGIGALERGLRTTPHCDTVQMLAAALGLGQDDVTRLEATVQLCGPCGASVASSHLFGVPAGRAVPASGRPVTPLSPRG